MLMFCSEHLLRVPVNIDVKQSFHEHVKELTSLGHRLPLIDSNSLEKMVCTLYSSQNITVRVIVLIIDTV